MESEVLDFTFDPILTTLQNQLAMNHIIVLANVFGPDAVKVLLFFKIDQIYWTQLKTFLIFLNYMTADELKQISLDGTLLKALKEI